MDTVTVGLGDRRYDILVGADWMSELGARVRDVVRSDRLVLVTDPDIGRLHAPAAMESLVDAGFEVEVVTIPKGETNKTVATAQTIWDFLMENGHTRQSALVALGGGIVGDIAGWAAACYMRGVDFVQVPTTLLSMVDSSVGGKTGVNHPRAKNTIGAFWQPRLVFMDMALLRTLPEDEFRSGFAEVIKHGMIRDADYFEFLEKDLGKILDLDGEALARVVKGSCEIKAAVVAEDEREEGLRAILNFGHTLGHAVESLGQYEGARHGEGVSIGMAAAAGIAQRMDLIDAASVGRLRRLIERAGLPIEFPPLDVDEVVERTHSDKKVRDGRVRFVLPTRVGEVIVRDDVPAEAIADVITEMGARAS